MKNIPTDWFCLSCKRSYNKHVCDHGEDVTLYCYPMGKYPEESKNFLKEWVPVDNLTQIEFSAKKKGLIKNKKPLKTQ